MNEMKDSEIEWIGQIPSRWEIQRLRFLCTIQTGNLDTQDNNPSGEYPFYVRSPIVERSNTFSFDNEAVLMAGDGVGAGKVFHYVTGKYGCHQRVYSMSNFKHINGKYLFYYLAGNFYKQIEASSAKSTVDSVRLPMIKDFPVVLPDKVQQSQIVRFLDRKCKQISMIEAKINNEINKLQEYKLSIITEAITTGLKIDVPMQENNLPWAEAFPTEWKQVRLGDLCDRPITYGIVKLGEEDDEYGVKVLRCSDVQPGFIDSTSIRSVSQDLSNEYQRTILKGGEIVINVRGTLGGCAIVPSTMNGYNIAREVAMVSVKKANPKFVMYNLLSHVFQSYQKYSLRGVVYVGLNINLLSKYPLFLPSLDEQNEIAKYLDSKCNSIDSCILKKQKVVDRLFEYKKSLIYEVVTGKKEV